MRRIALVFLLSLMALGMPVVVQADGETWEPNPPPGSGVRRHRPFLISRSIDRAIAGEVEINVVIHSIEPDGTATADGTLLILPEHDILGTIEPTQVYVPDSASASCTDTNGDGNAEITDVFVHFSAVQGDGPRALTGTLVPDEPIGAAGTYSGTMRIEAETEIATVAVIIKSVDTATPPILKWAVPCLPTQASAGLVNIGRCTNRRTSEVQMLRVVLVLIMTLSAVMVPVVVQADGETWEPGDPPPGGGSHGFGFVAGTSMAAPHAASVAEIEIEIVVQINTDGNATADGTLLVLPEDDILGIVEPTNVYQPTADGTSASCADTNGDGTAGITTVTMHLKSKRGDDAIVQITPNDGEIDDSRGETGEYVGFTIDVDGEVIEETGLVWFFPSGETPIDLTR